MYQRSPLRLFFFFLIPLLVFRTRCTWADSRTKAYRICKISMKKGEGHRGEKARRQRQQMTTAKVSSKEAKRRRTTRDVDADQIMKRWEGTRMKLVSKPAYQTLDRQLSKYKCFSPFVFLTFRVSVAWVMLWSETGGKGVRGCISWPGRCPPNETNPCFKDVWRGRQLTVGICGDVLGLFA